MTRTSIDTITKTVEKTREWIDDVSVQLHRTNPEVAYAALRSTLHALRDRLGVEEACHLAAQMPLLLKGIYFDGWDPTGKPRKDRTKTAFLQHIRDELRSRDDVDAEFAARAVFTVLAGRVSEGEVQDVVDAMPAEVRELWPSRTRQQH